MKVLVSIVYLSCITFRIPLTLADFVARIDINIFDLSSILMRLCRFLSLKHSSIQNMLINKYIRRKDPSIFINRYVNQLHIGSYTNKVSLLALKLFIKPFADLQFRSFSSKGLVAASIYLSMRAFGYKLLINRN